MYLDSKDLNARTDVHWHRCTHTDMHHHTDKPTLTTELTGNGIPTRKAIRGATSACGRNSVSYLTFNTQSTRKTMQGWNTVHTSRVKVFLTVHGNISPCLILTVHVTCHHVWRVSGKRRSNMTWKYAEFGRLYGRREEGRVDTGRIPGSGQSILSNIQT